MNKKVLISVLLLLSFIFIRCSSSNNSIQDQESVDLKLIDDINKYRIELAKNSSSLKKVKKVVEISSRKGELTALFNDAEEIKIMTFTFYENMSKKSTEYVFLDNDYLLYVNEIESNYKNSLNEAVPEPSRSYSSEMYFSENKIVLWVKNKINLPPEEYSNKTSQVFLKLGEILQVVSKN